MKTIPIKKRLKIPSPPSTLDAVARAKWIEVAPTLVRAGTLNRATMPILEAFCVSYSTWLDASQKPQTQTITTKSGHEWTAPSAWHTIGKGAFSAMARAAGLLGIAKLTRKPKAQKKTDPLAKLLRPRLAAE